MGSYKVASVANPAARPGRSSLVRHWFSRRPALWIPPKRNGVERLSRWTTLAPFMIRKLNNPIRLLPAFTVAGILSGLAPLALGEGVSLQKDIKPVLQEYCFDCHNAKKQKGDVNLVEVADN